MQTIEYDLSQRPQRVRALSTPSDLADLLGYPDRPGTRRPLIRAERIA